MPVAGTDTRSVGEIPAHRSPSAIFCRTLVPRVRTSSERDVGPEAASFRSAWIRVLMVERGYSREVRPISQIDPAAVAATSNSLLEYCFTTCAFGAKKDGSQFGTLGVSILLKVKLLESMERHLSVQAMVTLMFVSETTFVRLTVSSRPGLATVGLGVFAARGAGVGAVLETVAVVLDGASFCCDCGCDCGFGCCCLCCGSCFSPGPFLLLLMGKTGLGHSDRRYGGGGRFSSTEVWV
mmetsp:Transcript_3618/g.8730  ORF Transcript_3618/g.8730 Transcript_3618/m.8730 type:complete len:238 (+) Transcript_3618:442-1155(+)